jgi:hypothetical protein
MLQSLFTARIRKALFTPAMASGHFAVASALRSSSSEALRAFVGK